jgi:hypothetical protein
MWALLWPEGDRRVHQPTAVPRQLVRFAGRAAGAASSGAATGRRGTIGWLSTPDALVGVDTQYADTAAICLDGWYQALIPRLSLAATLGAAYDELTSAPRQ